MGLATLSLAVAAVAAPQNSKIDNNPDVIETRHYRLTMDKIEKVAAASETVNKMLAADPALKKQVDAATEDNNASIDQKAKTIDTKFPQIAAVFHRNGITSREYIVVTLAFMNDVMLVGMKKQGSIKTYPPNTITPENATFVEQNYDKLMELNKKMTPPDEGDQN